LRCNIASFFIGFVALVSIVEFAPGEYAHWLSSATPPGLIGAVVTSQPALPSSHADDGHTRKHSIALNVSQEKNSQEVVSPLTDEERALDLHDLILNQPDFVADLTFFRTERFGGGGGSERIARKGDRYREESQFWIFVGESDKPTARLFPQSKSYDDLEPARYESANSSEPFNPKTLALEAGVSYKVLGAVMIDGYRCIKIAAAREKRPKQIYLYAARELRNLFIIARVLDPPRSFVQRLSNVSFEVPDTLVEVPRDYKPIEHDRWTKVETAKVAYKGKPSRDYGVFRSPGGELFVWVNDAPYPWHYLVRPQEALVETAFQGLLVTRAGKYVWQTNEAEAFSRTYYRDKDYREKRQEASKGEENHVIVSQNSVKFPSNDYDRDRAMIEVRW